MRTTILTLSTSITLALGCGDADQGRSIYDQLAVDDEPSTTPVADEGELLPPLDCPRGGSTAPIRVVFRCTEIVIVSCKDLSNVVLELEDGSRQRFEGLSGHQATFAATDALRGAEITGVWVKAGANHSGDGPGYGERFDAPGDNCTPPNQPPTDECGGFDYSCTPGTPPPPRDPVEPPIGI
jgi:hypothetical protein